MATDRGLPAVPRGLDRSLTTHLQAMQNLLLRIAGMVRGSEDSRAVRVSDGSISTGATTVTSIQQASVLSQHLADYAVTTSKISTEAVTQEKIAASAVSTAKMVDYAVTTEKLADLAVSTGKVADGAINNEKLADLAVSESKLVDYAVTADKLADLAVSESKIADGAVSTEKLAKDAVAEANLVSGSVTSRVISAKAIGTVAISDNAVTKEKIATGVLPTFSTGSAVDGEEVQLPGKWLSKPNVMLSFVSSVQADTGAFGATDLQEILDTDGKGTGAWKFTAAGNFTWLAVGNEQ